MKDLGMNDSYFDLGVSSLTIIDLQLGVEGELGITVPTSELMRLQTMAGWIEAYSARASHGDPAPASRISAT
jgi:acyl carrier protein